MTNRLHVEYYPIWNINLHTIGSIVFFFTSFPICDNLLTLILFAGQGTLEESTGAVCERLSILAKRRTNENPAIQKNRI